MNKNKTLEYYNKNADNFAKTTINVDFYETQNRFSTLLPEHGYILDFGCGSGRDTKYFLEQGFYVDATDGSEEMCHIASNYTGIQVRRLLFEELDENKKYDGIMICINLFKSLIDKYLFFIKMKKINSIRDLGVLNDKIIAICAKIEKIEKNEIKIPELEKDVSKIDEYAKINDVNLNHFEGNNNLFSEPPTTCSN